MAYVSRTSTLRFDNGLGSFRQWQAVASFQDRDEGSVTGIVITQTTGGVPPTAPTQVVMRVRDINGNQIIAFNIPLPLTNNTQNFYFTSNGFNGSSARHGTVYLDIAATKTGGVDSYDYDTSGSPNTAPTGFSATQVDRGWIRGTTTLVEAVSNVAAGGAKNSPAEYDESLYVRCTLGSPSYEARALTVASSSGGLSGSTNSTTSATRDVSFANVVDERFATASTVVTWTVTAPNDSNTGAAYTTFTSTTDDSITVDPRLTCDHHFQIDDNAFAVASAEAVNQMLSSQSGFLWTRILGARGTGINGITLTQTLTPTNPGTAVGPTSSVTSTQDSQIGWSGRIDWTASKPGGTWTKSVDVTAPTDIDGSTYLLSSTDTYTMVSDDPRLFIRVEGGDPNAPTEPWLPGSDLTVGIAVGRFEGGNMIRLASDVGTCKFSIASLNAALGRLETIASDKITWEYTSTPATFSATVSPGDPLLSLNSTDFPASITEQWGDSRGGYFVQGYAEIGGIPKAGGGKFGDFTPTASEGSGSGGGGGKAVTFISVNEQLKAKKRKALEDLLNKDFTSTEFNDLLSSLMEKYRGSVNGPNSVLTDDEEALLFILAAIGQTE